MVNKTESIYTRPYLLLGGYEQNIFLDNWGYDNFHSNHETVENAILVGKQQDWEWYEIIDIFTLKLLHKEN